MIKATGLQKNTKHYNTVAIIGCQSSGKSTLLNSLFETNFQVMSDDKGRGQTTQGIWISFSTEYNLMILDCEGTDSKERGEERFKFEHCSSLFALALADVLIINMWTNVNIRNFENFLKLYKFFTNFFIFFNFFNFLLIF